MRRPWRVWARPTAGTPADPRHTTQPAGCSMPTTSRTRAHHHALTTRCCLSSTTPSHEHSTYLYSCHGSSSQHERVCTKSPSCAAPAEPQPSACTYPASPCKPRRQHVRRQHVRRQHIRRQHVRRQHVRRECDAKEGGRGRSAASCATCARQRGDHLRSAEHLSRESSRSAFPRALMCSSYALAVGRCGRSMRRGRSIPT